jgi:hypothetical protein
MPDEPAAIFYSFFPPVSAAHPRPAPACRCSSSRQRCILFTARVRCHASVQYSRKYPSDLVSNSLLLRLNKCRNPLAYLFTSSPVLTLSWRLRLLAPSPPSVSTSGLPFPNRALFKARIAICCRIAPCPATPHGLTNQTRPSLLLVWSGLVTTKKLTTNAQHLHRAEDRGPSAELNSPLSSRASLLCLQDHNADMVATVAAAGAAAAAASGRRRGARREPATMHAGIRRSRSEPHLRCPRRGGAAGAALTTSRSIGVFPFQFGAAPLRPPPLPDGGGDGSRLLTVADDADPPEPCPEMPPARRPEAHWLDRLLEVRSRFHDPTRRDVLDNDDDDDEDEDLYRLDADHHHDGGCGVSYEDDGEEEDARWDRDSFAKLLARAPLGEARLFAQLAFLCNMAYVIPEIKVSHLRDHTQL